MSSMSILRVMNLCRQKLALLTDHKQELQSQPRDQWHSKGGAKSFVLQEAKQSLPPSHLQRHSQLRELIWRLCSPDVNEGKGEGLCHTGAQSLAKPSILPPPYRNATAKDISQNIWSQKNHLKHL